MGKLRSIQVLRGLAACAVVFLHATGSGLQGAAGVDLFFVISGFIMATIPKGPSFLLDRFWRIFPLWWIALLPWLFTPRSASTIIGSVTLLPVALPALSVGWTLSFELLFYCAVAWSVRVGAWPLIGTFIVMAGAAAVTHAPLFSFLGNPMILEFLFGVGIARLVSPKRPVFHAFKVPVFVLAFRAWCAELGFRFVELRRPFVKRMHIGGVKMDATHPTLETFRGGRRLSQRGGGEQHQNHTPRLPQFLRTTKPFALIIFALICFTFAPTWIYPPAFAMTAPTSMWRVLYWGVPSAMIVYAVLSIEPLFAGKVWTFPVLLGDASYSIYLFHLLATDNLKLWWPLELAAGVGTGLVAWVLIERPIIRAKKRLMVVVDRSGDRVPGLPGIALVAPLVRVKVDDRAR